MSDAIILLSVGELPGLLREGLALCGGSVVSCMHVNNGTGQPGDLIGVMSFDDGEDTVAVDEQEVDLREGPARDAVTRAMWAILRPDEPEPMSAPAWIAHDSDATPAWSLAVFDGDGDSDAIYFAEYVGDSAPDGSMAVPALDGCYDEDADLLALRECARAVGAL